MAAMPIYGKNPLISSSPEPETLGLGMLHWGCGACKVCSNNDPRLTLTYLTSRSNSFLIDLNRIFFWKVDFSNTVKAKVIILTCYVETNDTMAINKFQRSRLTFALLAKVAYIVGPSIY